MEREIKIRKKRFAVFMLALMMLLNQFPVISANAAEYAVDGLTEGQTLSPGDTISNGSDTSCTIIYYDDGDAMTQLSSSAIDANTSHTVLDYTVTVPDGYIFNGWTVLSVGYTSGGVAESIYLQAAVAIDGTQISDALSGGILNAGAVIYSETDAYTVTYYDQDGTTSLMDAQQISLNTIYTVSAYTGTVPTGYRFAGWKVSYVYASGGYGSIDLTAQLAVDQYTITFDTAGGSTVAAITADYGTAVTAPAEPTREGYTFAGWDKEIPTTMPAENVTITSTWTANQYTITFDTAGGSTVAAITQDYGTAVTAPAEPTREGYTFAGWDKEIPTAMPAENVTITATWTANQYTITFDTAGGSTVTAITQDYGTAVTAPAEPTKTGYTFAGWDKEIPTTMPAENVTITATWTANQYTITFDTDGGSAVAAITQDYGTVVTAPAEPTRQGYTFAGWDKEIPSTMPAENMTITATWTANQYTITFDTAGGSTVAAITQDYGTAVTAPADPTREGYTFAGWDKEIPTTMPAENLTITATWTANQYTITFDTDGGSAVAAITQDYGTAVTAPADPTREGYTFAGWDKEIPATMPAENVTITATWTANTYAISYELDGGTNGDNPSGYTYGEGVTSFADASKEGYTFAGWYRDAAFTDPVTAISTTQTGNVTLYAKFNLYLIGKGTYYLEQGVQYQLDSGVTLVSGDSSVYGEGIVFYVPQSGYYEFE